MLFNDDDTVNLKLSVGDLWVIMSALGYKAEEIRPRTGQGFTATDKILQSTQIATDSIVNQASGDETLKRILLNAFETGVKTAQDDRSILNRR